ncbi:eukaryotic translation initiation factor 3 subunit 7-domain-containing protein [Chaetomidium leptoderma]|uniref:Eukaryotic translation initiation factor 3 subunit D n=1 Tax=Chaetomidium leptoderma TaxID=669021 RepID=A0AAN6VE99_9PEZI|nr:eukaryotic translation initiation factor 3 subunit 7-domain-containing protein [Chaetomidium leptoderma]
MASLSPNQPSQRGFGGGPSSQDKTPPPSTLNLDFLKSVNEKRTTRDGQPQKKRGPKPDSKPALTRRQELNRQAQRTHRERKELYIKALEDEVLRLKEIFSHVSQDKARLAEENRQLKTLLTQNGLGVVGSLTGGSSVLDDAMSNPSAAGYSPSASMAGSYVPGSSNTSAFTPPPLSAGSGGRGGISPHSATYPHSHSHPHHQNSGQGHLLSAGAAGTGGGGPPNENQNLDYEQAGIDFVLAYERPSLHHQQTVTPNRRSQANNIPTRPSSLEKPCMNHLPWMLERGTATGGGTGREPCGHALMASCPPEPFSELSPSIPFGHSHNHHSANANANANGNGSPAEMIGRGASAASATSATSAPAAVGGTWTLSKGDLTTLLDLSKRLNLDGEITPVMAWGMVLAHPRLGEMSKEDFGRLAEELGGKIRCYGFGAVMEEFEVRDALENIFSMKMDFGMGPPRGFILPTDSAIMAEATAGTSSLVDLINSLPEPDGTWGPPITEDTTLNGVPYAPFSKSDKLGRMADWTDPKDSRDGRGRQQYNRNYRDQQVYGAGSASLFTAPVAEDEGSFSVVSNVRDTGKTRFGRGAIFTRGRGQRGRGQDTRGGGRQQFQRGGRGGQQYGGGGYNDRGGRGGGRGGRRFGWKDYDKPQRNRDASINIKADWKLLEEIDFNRLSKLNLETDEGEDVDSYGFLYYYDRSYDKPPVKTVDRKLAVMDRAVYNVTTSSDPIIQDLAEKDEATIFATDSVLSMLMCAPRSVYPWDIVILRQGNKVFLDKRDNAALDMVTVNENAADAPLEASEGGKEVINQPPALAEEATYINHNFANQVVLENETRKVDMTHDNPFYNASEETEPPASKAYKYRRFDLSTSEEKPTHLIVRTELDAVQTNAINGENQFVTIHALNEFDNKAQGSGGALDWRSKLVSQRGAVVATEMKNNSCKLARWTVQSILAKADVMKLGFVSRLTPKLNDKHVVLGVVGWKPKDFANQMNLQLSNGWGIVRTIADMCLQREEGKYILVKDPNKSILRLYEIPTGGLDDDDEHEPEVVAEEEE